MYLYMAVYSTMWYWRKFCINAARTNLNVINNGLLHHNKCSFKSIRTIPTCNLRAYSNSGSTEDGSVDDLSRFEIMLREKRRQAKKSVLVHVPSRFAIEDLYKYYLKYGKIARAFHYSLTNEKAFILVEFEREDTVENLLRETKHFSSSNVIPVLTKCLYLQAPESSTSTLTPKVRELFIPPDVKIDTPTISDEDLMRSLQNADSIADQMIKLRKHLKLTELGRHLRFFVCHQLEITLASLFSNCAVLPFGSAVNGVGKFNCDLDMVLTLKDDHHVHQKNSDKEFQLYFHTKRSSSNGRAQSQRLLETLSDVISNFLPGCNNVQRILQARVPIIKFHHDLVNIECDLSMANKTGVYMSELLYLYGEHDERFPLLVYTVLKWAKEAGITHDSPGKWITNFSLTLMVVFFLQTRPKKILPSYGQLQKLAETHDTRVTEGIDCTFLRNIDKFPRTNNTETIDTLLLEFFLYFSTFSFKDCGLSLIDGRIINKPDYKSLHIENPLEITLNVSYNVSKEELDRITAKMTTALSTLEMSSTKSGQPWGLCSLFDVKPSSTGQLSKRFPLSNLFEKPNKQFEPPKEDKVHINKQYNFDDDDLVSKLELKDFITPKFKKSVKLKRTETPKSSFVNKDNRRYRKKTKADPWRF